MTTSTTSRMPAPRTERNITFERIPAPAGVIHLLGAGDWCYIVAPNSPFGIVPAKVVSVSDDRLSATVKVTAAGHFPFVRGEVYAGALDLQVIARTQVIRRGGVTKISGRIVPMSDRLTDYLTTDTPTD